MDELLRIVRRAERIFCVPFIIGAALWGRIKKRRRWRRRWLWRLRQGWRPRWWRRWRWWWSRRRQRVDGARDGDIKHKADIFRSFRKISFGLRLSKYHTSYSYIQVELGVRMQDHSSVIKFACRVIVQSLSLHEGHSSVIKFPCRVLVQSLCLHGGSYVSH